MLMERWSTSKLYTDEDLVRAVDIVVSEDDEPYRSPFRRDYARLVHSPSFRRLQGKTQVFPPHESDFFRNRLTHSLEVAQIAKSIAIKVNNTSDLFKQQNQIDCDIVEAAALAHDLGHPPFGHNGERALDDCLKKCGGFEGNAQTFRIVSKLEKKQLNSSTLEGDSVATVDPRVGLNWTRRTLASIIKYDNVIASYRGENTALEKGIYGSEQTLFSAVKKSVCPTLKSGQKFKTIEASIMDLADDIAYSTYDLEDALKSGFVDLLDFIDAEQEIYERVAGKVAKALLKTVSADAVRLSLFELFDEKVGLSRSEKEGTTLKGLLLNQTVRSYTESGYLRTGLTSELVRQFLKAVEVTSNESTPVLSSVKLAPKEEMQVECLKHFTFEIMIMSPRLRVAEGRGYDVVKGIFNKLAVEPKGYLFMPLDCRKLHQLQKDEGDKQRVIADFIAGMTDRYAVEYYGRLVSDSPASIFKDL